MFYQNKSFNNFLKTNILKVLGLKKVQFIYKETSQ